MPFTLIWGLLTSRLAGYIGSAAAIVLAVMLGAATIKAAIVEGELRHDVAVATSTLHLAQTNLATCKVNLADKGHALDVVEGSVAALRADSAARSAEASKALQQARVATAALSKREATLSAFKPTADVCADADSILLNGANP